MAYQLTIIPKPTYLHAIIIGANNKEDVMGYLREVLDQCVRRGCSRLLIEERLEGPRLSAMGVFQVASEGSVPARGHFDAIAYVDVNAEGELMKFAETTAVNRALPVKVFSSVTDAEKWLLSTDPGNASQSERDSNRTAKTLPKKTD